MSPFSITKILYPKLLLLILFFAAVSQCAAQTVLKYREHDIIDAGNGLKIEILRCRGEGENEECEVLYYTDKRQNGKRKWEKTSTIRKQEQSAQTEKAVNSRTDSLSTKDIPASSNETATSANSLITDTTEKATVSAVQVSSQFSQNNVRQPDTYDLSQCYSLALERNLTLQQAQNLIKANGIDNQTARLSVLPGLSYNLGHYFSFGKNIDPVTNAFVFQRFSGGFTGVSMQMDLFSGFNKVNLIKQSAYILESSEYAKKRAELELLTNVTLVYARLLLDKEQLDIGRNNIKSTEAQIEVINEKISVGRSTKYEGYLFNSRYSAELSNLITIQNDSAAALQQLKQLLNVNYQQPFNIASIDTSVFAGIYNTNITTADFIEIILQKHPAIKEMELQEEISRIGEKIAKSNAYPSISVGGNISSNYNANQLNQTGGKIPLPMQLNDNLGQNININLRVPIFTQLENKNRVRKERINISNAALAKEEAKNSIITNTLQLINDFKSAKEKYFANATAFELNRLSYSLYEEKYKLGQISSMELINARDILNNYTAQYIQSKLQLYFQHQIIELLNRY